MTKPIALTDAEMNTILELAAPLSVEARDRFLIELASELASCDAMLGPGLIYRLGHAVQRRIFMPPSINVTTAAVGVRRSHEQHRMS
jgi:hypothetical protein